MPINFQHTQKAIRFVVWGSLCQRILDWEHKQDELVFNEQCATGSFRGQFAIKNELALKVMREFKAQGKIMPYYGAGGSRGSCVYSLQRNRAGFRIGVANTTTKESAELTDDSTQPPFDYLRAQVRIWLATRLGIGKIAKPYLPLAIDSQGLQNLRGWKNWNDNEAATHRYIYHFGQVSFGSGFTNKVTDTLSGETTDATPYDTW